jgi:hypothetical protein
MRYTPARRTIAELGLFVPKPSAWVSMLGSPVSNLGLRVPQRLLMCVGVCGDCHSAPASGADAGLSVNGCAPSVHSLLQLPTRLLISFNAQQVTALVDRDLHSSMDIPNPLC